MTSRLFSLLQTWKTLCLSVKESSGRGLIASSSVPQHQLLCEEWPIVSAASPAHRDAVCQQCLQPLITGLQTRQETKALEGLFCSSNCRASEHRDIEPAGFEALERLCDASGERFPLMAARLAAGYVHSGSDQQLLDMETLAMAHVQWPPSHWIQVHDLILDGIRTHAARLPAESRAMIETRMQRLDLQWVVGVLARLHINTIRVDCIFPPKLGQSFAEMAEAVLNGSSECFSGSACYLLSSLFNHSCVPNVEMCWPANNSKLEMRAARAIDEGEELTIAYIDPNLPLRDRQNRLNFGYGFSCDCVLCEAEAAENLNAAPRG